MSEVAANQADGKSDEMRFGFGANWADYIQKNFSDERVEISKRHLLGFLKLSDLRGKSFLDIGCGSGLHSLAAWRSGAERIVSFDYDANSVATTRKLHELSGKPANWTIMQGSVLDRPFMDALPKSDIVYSWGVLHHTGSMWEAVENAARCLHKDSVYYIALYSKDVYVSPPYEYWLDVKRSYNRAGLLKKRLMEWQYAWPDLRAHYKQGENPLTYMRNYKRSRGMSYWHDVKDWLGGYPMEFAGNKETEVFGREKLGLELVHVKAGEGNTEFLFRPLGASNYWDKVTGGVPLVPINGSFESVGGHAWKIQLPSNLATGGAEKFMLYENGSPMGWPNAPSSHIQAWGSGRYCLEGRDLIFSTTDNQDPVASGKSFAFRPDFA